ncbi:exopolyphosphatase/pppGpp-phosphohydrolase [Hypnocyclicus thermotrophus]|uniref:Exopolyphosphatase/pppGpp-phosphohydrolase n=1 Tax=Hypnocyclicus thermotrophus TaxID=1627895 RepID=A0AA46DYA9_9FUSO|nr:HD domain-containing protein [Hypnocyclicus thermotrophus]TDT69775.1 exopolyphosphatase/pppGpp-phosphohydrolase [Hypnocyclicus thermotrophus]
MKNKIYAIIEISYMELICKIIEKKLDNSFIILENIYHPIKLTDEFKFEDVNNLCNLIKKLEVNLKTYNIPKINIKIFGVSSLGESQNKIFFKDILIIKTGYKIEFLDLNKKNIFIYKSILNSIINTEFSNKTNLIVGIDYGHITFFLIRNLKVIYYQNISLGTIKLKKIIEELNFNPNNLENLIYDYFSSYINIIQNSISKYNIDNIFIRGSLFYKITSKISNRVNDNIYSLPKENFIKFANEIKNYSLQYLSDNYNLSEEKSEIIFPKIFFTKLLISSIPYKNLYSINLTLIDSLIYSTIFRKLSLKYNKYITNSILENTKYLGSKFNYNLEHATQVAKFTNIIINSLKTNYNFNKNDILYLTIAAFLHDIGKYISIKNHSEHSYNLIMNNTIFGLSAEAKELIALISFYHNKKFPNFSSKMFKNFDEVKTMKIIKLTSILRIADSLDRAHKVKIKSLNVTFDNHTMILNITTNDKLTIEHWSFKKKSELFTDIFGLKTILLNKN